MTAVVGSPLVLTIAALRVAAGLESDDGSQDAALLVQERAAVAAVEGATHRRFQQPDETVEYHEGSGTRKLFLDGHAEDDVEVSVRERPIGGDADDWEEFEDFEVRKDVLIRTDGYRWSTAHEYEVTYDSGYDVAPADIQALIAELIGLASAVSTGSAGIVTETIGEYSYRLDTTAAAASSGVSATGINTLNNWRKVFV